MFTRLRSDHAKELKKCRKRIGIDISDICIYCDSDSEESIEHVLCECPQLEEKRRRAHPEKFTLDMMTTHPEVCRKVLSTRFKKIVRRK